MRVTIIIYPQAFSNNYYLFKGEGGGPSGWEKGPGASTWGGLQVLQAEAEALSLRQGAQCVSRVSLPWGPPALSPVLKPE